YGSFCNNHPPVHRMNFANAELTKISVNTFVTTKITFANMLAAICEELPGGAGRSDRPGKPRLAGSAARADQGLDSKRRDRGRSRTCLQARYQRGRGVAGPGYRAPAGRRRPPRPRV